MPMVAGGLTLRWREPFGRDYRISLFYSKERRLWRSLNGRYGTVEALGLRVRDYPRFVNG